MAQPENDGFEATNFVPVGRQATIVDHGKVDEDGQQVVDEIESLCMNCRDNVRAHDLAGIPSRVVSDEL